MPEPAGEPGDEATAFWAFSLEFYARPGVAATCLALQDGHGLDVNILLLCCWLGGSRGERLSPDDLGAAEAGVEVWRRSVVEPLRALRRALKGVQVVTAPTLREEVRRLELAAEREAQRLLVAALPPLAVAASEATAAADNLACYLALRGCAAGLADPLVAAL